MSITASNRLGWASAGSGGASKTPPSSPIPNSSGGSYEPSGCGFAGVPRSCTSSSPFSRASLRSFLLISCISRITTLLSNLYSGDRPNILRHRRFSVLVLFSQNDSGTFSSCSTPASPCSPSKDVTANGSSSTVSSTASIWSIRTCSSVGAALMGSDGVVYLVARSKEFTETISISSVNASAASSSLFSKSSSDCLKSSTSDGFVLSRYSIVDCTIVASAGSTSPVFGAHFFLNQRNLPVRLPVSTST